MSCSEDYYIHVYDKSSMRLLHEFDFEASALCLALAVRAPLTLTPLLYPHLGRCAASTGPERGRHHRGPGRRQQLRGQRVRDEPGAARPALHLPRRPEADAQPPRVCGACGRHRRGARARVVTSRYPRLPPWVAACPVQSFQYQGHGGKVRCISVHPDNKVSAAHGDRP